jgi:hypothetical protein
VLGNRCETFKQLSYSKYMTNLLPTTVGDGTYDSHCFLFTAQTAPPSLAPATLSLPAAVVFALKPTIGVGRFENTIFLCTRARIAYDVVDLAAAAAATGAAA